MTEDQSIDESAEDAADAEAARRVMHRIATGEEELIPDAMLGRILDGENKVRVWREHRGLSVAGLAVKAGIPAEILAGIEDGATAATDEVHRRIAAALNLDLDDIWIEPDIG